MNLLTDDISKLSFKVIKDEISKIDFNEFYNSSDYEKIVSILTADKRKNVSSLGAKIIKDKEKLDNEKKRIRTMYDFDKSFGDYSVIAGVDEVGRGPLAGPIVSCAVILDLNAIDDEDLENKKDENNNKSTYKSSLLSVVRIYSDREDIKEDSFLKEKTSAKYFEEIIDIEVSFLSENIKEFNSTLDKEYKKISDAKSKISELESDKKYQTESEQNQTDSNINKLNSLINSSNSTIENTTKSIKELEEKIEKLREKKEDF